MLDKLVNLIYMDFFFYIYFCHPQVIWSHFEGKAAQTLPWGRVRVAEES